MLTANADGYRAALDLLAHGVAISAVVDCLLVVEYGFLEPLKREVERWREAPR